ncbi:hypothetical protein, partial [Escherichia coli]|uniref:hypothetical protein n=1 Tax=Escherichia coli TaxID=562 RepID=UPI00390C537F
MKQGLAVNGLHHCSVITLALDGNFCQHICNFLKVCGREFNCSPAYIFFETVEFCGAGVACLRSATL